ncbi:MAG: glycosyltransferase family 9 protein, partial [Candidatus Kryptoniota bacterium]
MENDLLHNVEENVLLCEKLFKLKADQISDLVFPLSEEDDIVAENLLNSREVGSGKLLIGFHAGGSTLKNHINKRWEPWKFVGLGKLLIRELGAKLLIFGGAEEMGVNEEIIKGIGLPDAIPIAAPNIIQTAALIKRCDLFVTNDSSLMHIASAMKRKVVAIEGPLNTNYTQPWHTDYEIASVYLDCSPCFVYSPRPLKCFRDDVKFKCIRDITVDSVYEKVKKLVNLSTSSYAKQL